MQSVSHVLYIHTTWRTREKRARCVSKRPVLPASRTSETVWVQQPFNWHYRMAKPPGGLVQHASARLSSISLQSVGSSPNRKKTKRTKTEEKEKKQEKKSWQMLKKCQFVFKGIHKNDHNVNALQSCASSRSGLYYRKRITLLDSSFLKLLTFGGWSV